MPSFDEVTRSVGKRRVTERLPYSGSGVDALIAQVGAILKLEQDAQRIILDVTKSHIHLEKFVKGQPDKEEEQLLFDNIIRSNPMREYVPEKKLSSYEQLYNMFRAVTDEGLEVVMVFVGNLVTLDKWLPVSKKDPKLFGVKVKRLKNVPDDLIIICGAEWAEAEPEDIRFTVKGVMS
jgi:hypothetical protein